MAPLERSRDEGDPAEDMTLMVQVPLSRYFGTTGEVAMLIPLIDQMWSCAQGHENAAMSDVCSTPKCGYGRPSSRVVSLVAGGRFIWLGLKNGQVCKCVTK